MPDSTRNRIIAEIAGSIDIPDSAYEKAEARYADLGEWFGREQALCHDFNPHIHPQGSFRLGTVIRPVVDDGEYDLDMGCRLEIGITKSSHTQQQLKELVGADLESYRIARRIKESMEEKHRCWRLQYADTLKFHLDVVPSIPETAERRRRIREAIVGTGAPGDLATLVSNLTGAITDDRQWNYRLVHEDWRLSNSEGFARWFESRMKLAKALMARQVLMASASTIDDLPAYRWKSPLQRCVQLLKRHRDVAFIADPDGKPASIIITTLAAKAYQGEADVGEALYGILSTMGTLVSPYSPRVPNPVNPSEDFADRWSDANSRHHNLEFKFWQWLRQVQMDFDAIGNERRLEPLAEAVRSKLGTTLSTKTLGASLGLSSTSSLLKPAALVSGLSFPNKPIVPRNPAGFA